MRNLGDMFEDEIRRTDEAERAFDPIHGRLTYAAQQWIPCSQGKNTIGKSRKKVLKGLEIHRSLGRKQGQFAPQLDITFRNAGDVKARKVVITLQDLSVSPPLYTVKQWADTKTKSVDDMPGGGTTVTIKEGWQPIDIYGPSTQTGLTEQAVEEIFNNIFHGCAEQIRHIMNKEKRSKRKALVYWALSGAFGVAAVALVPTCSTETPDAQEAPQTQSQGAIPTAPYEPGQ